jgi:2-keto-4-pentenoate hydratase
MTSHVLRKEASPAEIAMRLVSARLDARALAEFPGPLPETLEQSYATQEVAIHVWPDEIVGWKIGLVGAELRERLGSTRVSGPIFSKAVRTAGAGETEFPVFVGGFAAVEAEFVFRMGADAPAAKFAWSEDEAARYVEALHIGVETAGSPMAFINDLGATVVASDFGNNAGLILGPEVKDWRKRLPDLTAMTEIDGCKVGEGKAMNIPGGPMAGLTFLLEHLAKRGRPLRAGQYVSSGAVTGVHDIKEGQRARLSFGAEGEILCRAVPAQPSSK